MSTGADRSGSLTRASKLSTASALNRWQAGDEIDAATLTLTGSAASISASVVISPASRWVLFGCRSWGPIGRRLTSQIAYPERFNPPGHGSSANLRNLLQMPSNSRSNASSFKLHKRQKTV